MNDHGIMVGDLWEARTEINRIFIVLEVKDGTVYYAPIKDMDFNLSLTIKNFLQYRVKMK